MKVTFLVEINLDDVSLIAADAEDIHDKLSDSYEVLSVKPWSRAAIPLTEPPSSTQQ